MKCYSKQSIIKNNAKITGYVNNRFLLFILSSIPLFLQAQNAPETFLYTAEKIYQSDTAFGIVEAMVVEKNTIVFLGNAKVADSIYPKATHIAFKGKYIYPGFIDAHCHFLSYCRGLTQANLWETQSEDAVIKRLKKYHKTNKEPWIIGQGWDQNNWPGTTMNGSNKPYPNMDKLNKAFPNVPVCLKRIDGHAVWINSAAKRLLLLNTDSLIDGGLFIKTPGLKGGQGDFSGICIDQAADFVQSKIPVLPFSSWKPSLLKGLKNCYAFGLTTLDEAGLCLSDINLIMALQENGEMDMRIYAMLSQTEENLNYLATNGMIQTEKLSVRSMKLYLDGALGSNGALLKKDYCGQKGYRGLQLMSSTTFDYIQQLLLSRGYQVCVHAIGDSANAMALRSFNKNIPEGYDARWRIEHAQIVSQKDQKLFAKRSIIPSVQPTHATSDAHWAENRLCGESGQRISGAYAYADLLKQAKLLALGTDFPVEGLSPIHTFYSATQRMDAAGHLSKPFMGNQALTRKQALWGMTLWAAYSNFDEGRLGSLEEGKLADFVILDTDIMTIEAKKLLKTKTVATYIDGKRVW